MMASRIATINAKDLTNRMIMHVEIKRVRQWRIRVKVATLLIRLAAWVVCVNVEIKQPAEELAGLTTEDQAALDAMPNDAVEHWLRGEKWDFEKKKWLAQLADAEGE